MAGSKDTKVPITISRGAFISMVLRDYDGSDWCINDIAGDANGNIAITGQTSKSKSYISSFSLVARQGYFNFPDSPTENAKRYCDILPGGRIATVTGHEVGILNTTNALEGTYSHKDINTLCTDCRIVESLCCVAWDATRNLIIVGEKRSRNLYQLDENLNFIRKISLPRSIKWPFALKVYKGDLLVCDQEGRGFFSVSMTNRERCFKFEMPDGAGWWPNGVCTDHGGHIYVLWSAVREGQRRCQLIKYSRQGDQLLFEKVDGQTQCLTTVNTNEGEKLILAPSFRGILMERPLLH